MLTFRAPNLVDHSFVWETEGIGIYQHDCDELAVAHNLVGRSTKEAIKMRVNKGPNVGGRLASAKRCPRVRLEASP